MVVQVVDLIPVVVEEAVVPVLLVVMLLELLVMVELVFRFRQHLEIQFQLQAIQRHHTHQKEAVV